MIWFLVSSTLLRTAVAAALAGGAFYGGVELGFRVVFHLSEVWGVDLTDYGLTGTAAENSISGLYVVLLGLLGGITIYLFIKHLIFFLFWWKVKIIPLKYLHLVTIPDLKNKNIWKDLVVNFVFVIVPVSLLMVVVSFRIIVIGAINVPSSAKGGIIWTIMYTPGLMFFVATVTKFTGPSNFSKEDIIIEMENEGIL